jgi:ectoine hydroxylase
MIPLGRPGLMTEQERFQFDTAGYLVIPGALSPEESQACLEAAKRLHAAQRPGEWRQLGATYEQEPAMERLMDHPSVLPKVRALLGDYFILQSSWCTVVPAGFKGGGFHQDGSGVYEFRRLASARRTPGRHRWCSSASASSSRTGSGPSASRAPIGATWR